METENTGLESNHCDILKSKIARYIAATGITVTVIIAALDAEIRYYSNDHVEANVATQTGDPLAHISAQIGKDSGHMAAGVYNPIEDSTGGHSGKEAQLGYRRNATGQIETSAIVNDVTLRDKP